MKSMIYLLTLLFTPLFFAEESPSEGPASKETSEAATSTELAPSKTPKEEVLSNPTLKTLSGALSPWSFYSSFSYKGGSLANPGSAERPNITDASEKPSLQSLSGNLGMKYRIAKNDNLSMQVGTFMTTPFHSSHTSKDAKIQRDFDNNSQNLDIDDPKLSYFKTYYIGPVQSISFVTLEKTTTGLLRDYGYWGNVSLSQASAIALRKNFYIAGTFGFVQYFFDKDHMIEPKRGRKVSLEPYQTERIYKFSLSAEYYPIERIAVRAITDVGTYSQMKGKKYNDVESRNLQQTLAMTFFVTRDISFAPSMQFIITDVSAEKTNLGLTLNMNI